jgi:hypothetical protein
MTILVCQILVAAATVLVVFLHWQSCSRRHRRQERRVVSVRVETRPPVPYVSRVGGQRHNGWHFVGTRTVVLATLPIPIRGTIKPAEQARLAPKPLLSVDLRFPPPDAVLMQRVLDGLRALPGGHGKHHATHDGG